LPQPSKPTNSADRKRLMYLSLAIFAFFSILIAEFYNIQILEGDKWSKEANKQHFFIVKEPFMRGRFISNSNIKKGHPEAPQSFVIDVQKYHLYTDPESIPIGRREAIAENLSIILNLQVQQQKLLRGQFDRKSRSRKLAMWLDKDARDNIMQWWLPYARTHKIPRNALFFVSD